MENFSPPDQNTKKFLDEVKTAITGYGMIQHGDCLLVALSGGPDSVALLRGLLALQTELGIKNLGAAHLNHMLRKENAKKDQEFSRTLAEKYQCPFFTRDVDVKAFAEAEKLSLEAAGRKARYEFFQALATEHGFTKIATGHNGDDNAEQILMALLRGSGPTGMKGIAPVRGENPKIIRPLIHQTKSQIIQFLDYIHQDFMVDQSNADPVFLRNRIRNQLIPLLEKEYNPNIRQTLDRSAAIFREDEHFWDALVERTYPQCLEAETQTRVTLKIPALLNLPPALMNRILRKAIFHVKTNLNRISLVHIRDIRTLITESESGKSLDFPGRIRIHKKGRLLTIKKEDLPLRQLGKKNQQTG